MLVRWTVKAAADLEAISDYLHTNHPDYAQRTIRTIYDSIMQLRRFPATGRVGSRLGTRELVFTRLPYVVIFRINQTVVEVLRIHHGSQNWKE